MHFCRVMKLHYYKIKIPSTLEQHDGEKEVMLSMKIIIKLRLFQPYSNMMKLYYIIVTL